MPHTKKPENSSPNGNSNARSSTGGRLGKQKCTSPLCALKDNLLVGLVVKASASRAEDPGFESRLRRDFSGSNHTSDLKIGTPVAVLPGVWCYRVSAGTGGPVTVYCDWVRWKV